MFLLEKRWLGSVRSRNFHLVFIRSVVASYVHDTEVSSKIFFMCEISAGDDLAT